MAINIWIGKRPDYRSEREAIIHLCRGLKDLEEWYGIFVNFALPRGGTIDAVVFSERGVFMLEFKTITGTLEASLNGKWYVQENPKSTKLLLNKGNKNPYQQIQDYFYSFLNFLAQNSHKYRNNSHKSAPAIYKAIVIVPDINENSNIEKHKHIEVIGLPKACKWIFSEGKPGSGLTLKEVQRLAELLHLEPSTDFLTILKGPTSPLDFNKIKSALLKYYTSNEPFIKPYGIISSPQKLSKRVDVMEEISKESRIIILGEMGYGKTVICYKYALKQLKSTEINSDSLLPLVLPLSHYSADGGIPNLIRKTIEIHGVRCSMDDVNLLLEGDKKLIFIFDGLNETNEKERAACIWEIKHLMSLYPHHQIIVTCRSEYYKKEFQEISTIQLQPWSESQIIEYLTISIGSQETIRDFLSKSQLSGIKENLLSRPLFAKLLVEEYHASGELPSNQRILLEGIVKRRLEENVINEESVNISVDIQKCLAEIAFWMKENSKMAEELSSTREKVLQWFLQMGGERNLGYSGNSLWLNLLNSGFIRAFGGKISFVHEIWQEYFTSLKLIEEFNTISPKLIELVKDAWWNDCILYSLHGIEPKRTIEILKIALENGNEALVGYALRREAGINANNAARSIVSTFLKSKIQAHREKAVNIIKFGGAESWCIRKLLEIMSEEQKKLIPPGKDESIFDELGGGWRSGPEAKAGSFLFSLIHYFPPRRNLPSDVIDEILNVEEYLPSARAIAARLLEGAIGVLPDEILITILRKRANDPRWVVRFEAIEVIQIFLNYLRSKKKNKLYNEGIKILKQLTKDKYLSIYQTAFEALMDLGEYNIEEWTEKQAEVVYSKAKKAITLKDPDTAYSVLTGQFDPLIGEAYFRAVEMLSKDELRTLLRIIIDNVIENRLEIDFAMKELESTTDIKKRSEIIDSVPQLLWIDFAWIVKNLTELATPEDIKRFRELLVNPPKIWEQRGWLGDSPLEISWAAAEGLVMIGSPEVKKVLSDLLSGQDVETIIIATLALELGTRQSKWEVSPSAIIACKTCANNIKSHKFLSILSRLESLIKIKDRFLVNIFYKKFGKDKIRQMAREAINEKTGIALRFLEKYGTVEDAYLVREILRDPKKAKFHEKAKRTLRILTGK